MKQSPAEPVLLPAPDTQAPQGLQLQQILFDTAIGVTPPAPAYAAASHQ
jgi:hypothetical protein